MLKEAIEKIEAMSGPKVFEADGRTYIVGNDGDAIPVTDEHWRPETLKLNSLDALVKMVKGDCPMPVFVSVKAHDRVSVYSAMTQDLRFERNVLYVADATDIPGWDPEVHLPFDQASVALMTRFQDGGDREYTLLLLSQITTGAKVTYTDNGIASTIVTQKGAALAENTTIRPLVKLRPYRTFQEVEQPEGIFLIRISERGITFTEADGGMWKLTARNTVKNWLQEQFKDLDGITVML